MENKNSILELIDSINIPKQVLEKSEALIKALFGASITETSGIIADQLRLRRFKNQLSIFEKANEYIKEKGIDPKRLELKVLAPMIEFSSLEENEGLQQRWSRLIANTLTGDRIARQEQKCIQILSQISPDEALLLDKIFELAEKYRNERFQLRFDNNGNIVGPPLNEISINETLIYDFVKFEYSEARVLLEGLISLELLKWSVPNVEAYAEKPLDDPEETEIEIDISLNESSDIYITYLGVEFVKICKG